MWPLKSHIFIFINFIYILERPGKINDLQNLCSSPESSMFSPLFAATLLKLMRSRKEFVRFVELKLLKSEENHVRLRSSCSGRSNLQTSLTLDT